MLKVERLVVRGLPPLSFEVARGECLAVEGPSGSGKTLLLRAIADLDPAEGAVYLDGIERGTLSGPQWRKRVRFVAAEARWWAPTAAGHFADVAAGRHMLADLGLDADCADRPIDVLSSGERQRLALIRAVLDAPDVLLLDEPTGALDVERRGMVEAVVEARLADGAIVVLVSHDAGQIQRLSHARLQLAPLRAEPVDVRTVADLAR